MEKNTAVWNIAYITENSKYLLNCHGKQLSTIILVFKIMRDYSLVFPAMCLDPFASQGHKTLNLELLLFTSSTFRFLSGFSLSRFLTPTEYEQFRLLVST